MGASHGISIAFVLAPFEIMISMVIFSGFNPRTWDAECEQLLTRPLRTQFRLNDLGIAESGRH